MEISIFPVHVSRMENAPISTLQKRVKERMDALELNAFETAKRANLGSSYVRDILRGKARNPAAANLAKLAEVLRTTPEYLLGRKPEDSTLRPVAAKVQGVSVVGKVSASSWYTVDDHSIEYYGDDVETVPSVSGYPIEWQFGLIVEGNCLNRIAADGTRLVCLDLIKSQQDIQENDLVIIERTRFSGQMRQITAKRVRASKQGFELWPESDDPAHQDPILLNEARDDETLRVWGKVLWILKRP